MYSAFGDQAEIDAAGSRLGERSADITYQPPYLPTNPRQTTSRSAASGSFATLAFLAAAVITMRTTVSLEA
jgi:hypothetical protein